MSFILPNKIIGRQFMITVGIGHLQLFLAVCVCGGGVELANCAHVV